MSRPFGEVSYTLKGLYIAAFNIIAGTFGTPELIDDGQMVVYEPEADTDKMRGYGVYTRGLAVSIGTKIKLKAGGLDTSALVIIAGATVTVSGVTPNQIRKVTFPAGGSGLPYFGVIGLAATDDGGVAVVGHKAVKLDKVPQVTQDGEANKFSLWETDGYSFPQGNILETLKQYETEADFDAPTTGAEFLTWFT